jgi:SLA1 homology domain 1, SHD1
MTRSLILALLSVSILAPSLHARTWTDARDRKVEAEYTSCHNGIVRMKTAAGKTYRVPMWTLSSQDQMFVVKTKGWAVVKAHRQANVKASLDVRLAERVSKAKLIAIANELQGFADNKQPRLFIVHYLPNMKIDAGGWATSHFNPKLEIRIIGTTKEEYARLQKEASKPTGSNVIGRWVDKTAFPGVISFLRKNGKVFKTKTFQDGSKGEYEMVVRKVGSQTRYMEKNSKTSDYVIIKANGDLAHGDDEGLWATSSKIK